MFAPLFAQAPDAGVMLYMGPWTPIGAAVVLGTLLGGGLALGLTLLGRQLAHSVAAGAAETVRAFDRTTDALDKLRDSVSGLNATVSASAAYHRSV